MIATSVVMVSMVFSGWSVSVMSRQYRLFGGFSVDFCQAGIASCAVSRLACRRAFPAPSAFVYRALGLSKLFPRSKRFGSYNLTYLSPDVQTEVDAVVGACMLVRASVVREVGLLDEAYFMYGEDLDWAYRIKQYGWKIMYVPSATVHHYKRASSRQRPFRSIRAFYDAMRVFHRKHYAATTPAPLNLAIEAGITLKEYLSLGRNLLRPSAARRVG